MSNEDSKIISIYQCARCGQDHIDIEIRRFTRPMADPFSGTVWKWWAWCPVTQEPVVGTNGEKIPRLPDL